MAPCRQVSSEEGTVAEVSSPPPLPVWPTSEVPSLVPAGILQVLSDKLTTSTLTTSSPALTRLCPTATPSARCLSLVGSTKPSTPCIFRDNRHWTLASVPGARYTGAAVATSALPLCRSKGISSPCTLIFRFPKSKHALLCRR
ncbi:hypothetical protein E2C01_026706 [Portunus trituberculatus]|uniref:Uncharacterized protein n=1 Tax=Portunus trituberculatus TaxID=210409 RepID=A0A5B7EJN1_PORTR|nr:hypothetical protein [Portunus trituberculatus]